MTPPVVIDQLRPDLMRSARLAAWRPDRASAPYERPPEAGLPRPISMQAPVVQSLASRPELRRAMAEVDAAAYPTFMQHTDFAPHWPTVYETFPDSQLVLVDPESGRHLAHGNLVPLAWDGRESSLPRSAVEMVERALADRRRGLTPTAYGALQAVVNPAEQGAGLSVTMLRAMAGHASAHGVADLFAPIRPTWKPRYPHTALSRYVTWTRPDGLPLDPWQRVHHRLGATAVSTVHAWLTVSASLDAWAAWTGTPCPPMGPYIVPGGLVPVRVDLHDGTGRYAEPHLWMRYRL